MGQILENLKGKLLQYKGQFKQLRAQSNMPHPVRKNQPRWETSTGVDIAIAEGNWGITSPESLLINKRLAMPFGSDTGADASVDQGGVIDFQILSPQLRAMKVEIVTGFRNRVKGFTNKMFGERR